MVSACLTERTVKSKIAKYCTSIVQNQLTIGVYRHHAKRRHMGFEAGGFSGSTLKRAKGSLDTAPMVPRRPADDAHLIGGFNMFQYVSGHQEKEWKNR